MNSKLLLTALVIASVAAVFLYLDSRPRYRMAKAGDDSSVFRLDSVTGELEVCGPAKNEGFICIAARKYEP